jgi:Family of unknown function (DUF5715)
MGANIRFSTISVALLALLATATPASAVRRYTKYHHHKAHVRHVVWNPVLRGSYDSMLRQNEEIDRLQLPRIADDTQLEELERTQELVQIQESKALRISPVIQSNKRYVRPWTNLFLTDLSEAFYNEFHAPLQVNSAVRTMEQQYKLRWHNRNAAPEAGDNASSHLAGITVDLAKRGLNKAQYKFMVDYLKNLRDLGLIEAADERRTHCLHVMVSDRYTEWRESSHLDAKITGE